MWITCWELMCILVIYGLLLLLVTETITFRGNANVSKVYILTSTSVLYPEHGETILGVYTNKQLALNESTALRLHDDDISCFVREYTIINGNKENKRWKKKLK